MKTTVTLEAREAVVLLSLCLKARLDDMDGRPEVLAAEDKLAEAIRKTQAGEPLPPFKQEYPNQEAA